MIALAALALAAGGAAPTLRPVLDRPYRLTVSEERNVAGRLHHFSAERRIVFRRDGDGLVAEVTLMRLTHDFVGESGRRFLAGAGALKGRAVRFHLAADGNLRSIDDEAALWEAMTAGLRSAHGQRGASNPAVTAMAALPIEARRPTIASILMPTIAGSEALRTPAAHPVSLRSRMIATGAPLTGTETVTIGGDAMLHIITQASAAVDASVVSLDRERVVDRDHGLVVGETETQTIRLGDAVEVTRKRTVLTPPV